MDKITLADALSAFNNISGITVDQVEGISLIAVSQAEFDEGVTSTIELMLLQHYHYLDCGVPHEGAILDLPMHKWPLLDHFEHDDIRDGEGVTAKQIRECFAEDLLQFMKVNEWKVFWGDDENGRIEVKDFWQEDPTILYFFGETADT